METNTDKVRLQMVKNYFEEYKKSGSGIYKALNLLLPEILDLRSKGIKNREQIAIFENMFDIKINYETYRQFVYKKLRKISQKKDEFVKKSTFKKEKKISCKESKKVAQNEPKNDDDSFDLNETFERKTEPKFKGLL